MTKLIAKRYRYADGGVYNVHRYNLLAVMQDTTKPVGGALVMKDKVIAWAGRVGGGNVLVKDIIAYSTTYVWGATMQEALTKIKPHLSW